MTDATAGRGGVGIRLYVSGGEVVKRTFDQVGDSGKKMWGEIAVGERSANPAVRALSAASNEARGAVDGLAGRAGSANTILSAFGATGMAVAAALGAMSLGLAQAREGMQFAADLTDTADRIGVGAEALQELRYVADEAGVSVESFQANLEKLNGVVGAFKVGIGDGKLKPIFEELGITKAQLQDVDTAQDMMMLLADTLGQIRDRAVQVRLARGLGVEESLPILRLGSEAVRELSADARELGLVMSDDVREQFDEADRAMERAQQRIDLSLKVAVVGLADDFAGLVEGVADAIQWFGKLDAAMANFRVHDNPATRAGQFVNDQIRRVLGMGPNSDRAMRNANASSGDVDDPMLTRELIALSMPVGGFERLGHGRRGGGGGAGDANRARAEADRKAREAEREAEQKRQREERASDDQRRLDREFSSRMGDGQPQTMEARAEAEIERLQNARADRLRQIERAEQEYIRSEGLRGLTKAEADLQRTTLDQLAVVEEALVQKQLMRDLAAQRLENEQDAAQAAVDLMDIDAQMATTSRERARIERELLLRTIAIARRAKRQELDLNLELDQPERESRMAAFERNAAARVQLFDHQEDERIKAQFKGYGREVVDAIQAGRIGEYIGDRLKERLLDGALDAFANLFKGGGGAGGKGGGWMATAVNAVASIFGGGRAAGGSTEPGRFYTTVEHGRPELLMIAGSGHVTGPAETARMIRDFAREPGLSGAAPAPVSIRLPDITINAPGADPAALARVEAEVRRLREEMPGMAVQAVRDANERRIG
ncbi:hypothetical protein [uncultured Brevundimonas sp.]|uniref:hypothetical protein n=1 Tax=uncultured Brevundimonas sp. TaxID=213418 RepID=UPI0025E1B346|nr:hypothetical protein [uncultured Brevundimonas sp.]